MEEAILKGFLQVRKPESNGPVVSLHVRGDIIYICAWYVLLLMTQKFYEILPLGRQTTLSIWATSCIYDYDYYWGAPMGKKIKLGKSRLARQPNLTRKSTDPTAVVVVAIATLRRNTDSIKHT